MTKYEAHKFVEHVLNTYDESWRDPIMFDLGCQWIPFRGLVEDAAFNIMIDCSTDDASVTFTFIDETEFACQEMTCETYAEALDTLELWIHEIVQFGYFYIKEDLPI